MWFKEENDHPKYNDGYIIPGSVMRKNITLKRIRKDYMKSLVLCGEKT